MASKAKTFLIVGIIWFLIAAAIWLGLGYMFLAMYNDPQYQYDQGTRGLFSTIASIFIIFGIIAFVFLVLAIAAVFMPFKHDRYDAAYNRGLLVGGVGLFFGLGAGIMLILAAKKYIKDHPKYMATLPVPTPICERCGQPVQFDKQVGGWYCPTCKIFLTKGVPKPQAPAKPVLPPTMPPKPVYQPPQQPYPPQGMAPKPMGPPPQGYPPQGMPPKPMGPPPQGYPPQQGMAPPPKPMGPPPQGYPPQQGMAPPKPMGPPPQGYPPHPPLPPNARVLACSRCGKTFQWTVTDPNQRMAKCPWCNNELMIQ